MPRADQLPHEIAEFARINAATLDTGPDFRIHANRLIDEMERRRSETFVQTASAGDQSILDQQAPRLSQADLRRRAAFLEKARISFAGLKTKSLYFAGDIPQSKSIAATQAYAPKVTTDSVLLLYDPTMFGGAKFGILLKRSSKQRRILKRSGFNDFVACYNARTTTSEKNRSASRATPTTS